MAESNDKFCMLSFEDKLDGDSNYPLWTYLMQHVLIVDASTDVDFADVVQDTEWMYSAYCQYDPSMHDACLAIFVDDMLLTGPNECQIADFKVDLNASFEILDLGHLHHYLGLQLKQSDGGIALCQTKYIETLLLRFNLKDCKPMATPMEIGLKLSFHAARDYFYVTLYRIVVGCLIYECNTRLYIWFAVS
ncbi:hypothetical protein L7F22_015515 [Adiantum nelumboides]|nr:hypothetical protein [Adiantum nelumboides]